MKGDMMNVDALSRAELLTLLSVLEGELEAQDVVIHALRAQHRDAFVQERYGQYDLSDPFLALQRDSEGVERQQAHSQPRTPQPRRSAGGGPNPLAVLKLVMAHCKRMQERMMGQLAAVESRHKRTIADLEEEKRRRTQDLAQGDDVTFMLKTERDKLLQQLEIEQATVQKLQKERAQAAGQAEETLSQQQQLASTLTLELQRASSQAQEEAQKVSQLRCRLQEESGALEKLRAVLETEKGRAVQLEARAERQLAEFDTEREQMKARIRREEERSRELERQVEELRKMLEAGGGVTEKAAREDKQSLPRLEVVSASVQTEPDGKAASVPKQPAVSKVNGHHAPRDGEPPQEARGADNGGPAAENGGGAATLPSPVHPHPHPHSPSSTASSSLSSSPISSPVLAKRLGSPGFHQSSYQAGVNQRFHAARHKFQSQAELEQQQQHQQAGSAPLSPRDLSPTATPTPPPPENSTAKQMARNTVTQVLSRFTSQQAGAKIAPVSSSPFGTDYRNLAASPPGGRSPSSGPLSPGIRSPLTPRSERTHPPPIPPKKPGMSPTPGSPGPSARNSVFPELTGNCGHSSNGQEGTKEPDLVLSSSS